MSLTPVHDRARSKDSHSSVVLQQGLYLRDGRLPVFRLGPDQARYRSKEEDASRASRQPRFPRRERWRRPGDGYRIIGPGIGGTGVVTINALLATAAWIDGLHVATLDQTGTAQKGGAVVSHLLLSEQPIEAPAKVNAGNADLILGFDLLGVMESENLGTANRDRTVAVVNTDLAPTIDTIRNRSTFAGPAQDAGTAQHRHQSRAQYLCRRQSPGGGALRQPYGGQLFMTGFAFQGGLIPISLQAHRAGHRVERRRHRA